MFSRSLSDRLPQGYEISSADRCTRGERVTQLLAGSFCALLFVGLGGSWYFEVASAREQERIQQGFEDFSARARKKVRALAASPDGRTLAAGLESGQILFRNLDATEEATLELQHDTAVRCLAFSPDGELLAAGGGDRACHAGELRIWDHTTGELVATLDAPQMGVETLAFSPDGQLLAATGGEGMVRIWRTSDWTCAHELTLGAALVRKLAFAPNGKHFVAAGSDGRAVLWRLPDFEVERSWQAHGGEVWSIAFTPDGRQLATGGDAGVVRIWDLQREQPLRELVVEHERCRGLAYSPNGAELMVAGGEPGVPSEVVRFRMTDGAKLSALKGHANLVHAVVAIPHTELVVTSSNDGTVRCWNSRDARQTDLWTIVPANRE